MAVRKLDAGVLVPDLMDRAIKTQEAFVDPALRLMLPSGLKIALPQLREKLDEVTVEAEDSAGEIYEVTLREVFFSLLFDPAEIS